MLIYASRFIWNQEVSIKGHHFQWDILPFRISLAPWLFTQVTKPIFNYLHCRRLCSVFYLYNRIPSHLESSQLRLQVDFTIRLLTQLGWLVNLLKLELEPKQDLQLLGITFITTLNHIIVPEDRWGKIQAMICQALHSHSSWSTDFSSRHDVQRKTILVPIPNCSHRQFRPDSPFGQVEANLLCQTLKSSVWGGTYLTELACTIHLFVDTSLRSWGAHLDIKIEQGNGRDKNNFCTSFSWKWKQ